MPEVTCRTYILRADPSGLEELVHALKQHHFSLLQRSIPGQPHGLLDDACSSQSSVSMCRQHGYLSCRLVTKQTAADNASQHAEV